MQQITFKSVDAYREWRAHWRRNYNGIASSIHELKKLSRQPTNNAEEQQFFQSALRSEQMFARSLMIARVSVEQAYREHRLAQEALLKAAA